MSLRATTQEIPAWSRNLCTNAPEMWREVIGERAAELSVSSGEVQRRWMLLGAMLDAKELGKKMLAAHHEYYPNRQVVLPLLIVLLAAGLFFQAVGARHDLRRSKVAHRANIHRIFREGLVSA